MASRKEGTPAPDRLTPSTAAVLQRVRAVMLLAGGARPNPFTRAVGRSRLNLPLDSRTDVLSHWVAQVHAFSQVARLQTCPLWIRMGVNDATPRIPADQGPVQVRVETDDSSFRGTGGVLRDLVAQFDADDYLLVAGAAQVMLSPLSELGSQLAALDADVSLLSHEDGTPCGFWLVRCGALMDLPTVGFVDFKEQALPRLAERHMVRVLSRPTPVALPLLTRSDYLTALRWLEPGADSPRDQSPFAEGWQSSFSLVEEGAQVASSARIHDSVVLAGAHVGEQAVVVRSVIGPGSIIREQRRVVDMVTGTASSGGRGQS